MGEEHEQDRVEQETELQRPDEAIKDLAPDEEDVAAVTGGFMPVDGSR